MNQQQQEEEKEDVNIETVSLIPESYINNSQQINNINNDPIKYFDLLFSLFKKIEILQKPIKFEKNLNSQQTFIGFFGEIGSGKSTLSNIGLILENKKQDNPQNIDKKNLFESGISQESVTQNVSYKNVNDIFFIDTPGSNDPKKHDFLILYDIFQNFKSYPYNEGISGLVQCIMVPQSGRMKSNQIKPMCHMILSLTLPYPDFNIQNAPRINVMFTNFSVNSDQEQQDDIYNFDNHQNKITFKDLITFFKQQVVNQLQEYMMKKISKEKLEEIVEKLLPQDHFYAYKIRPESELQQVSKLIEDNKQHGRWQIKNKDNLEMQLLPVQLENDMKKLITENLSQNIQDTLDTITKATEEFYNSQQQKNEILEQYKEKMQEIKIQFNNLLNNSPWCLLKLSNGIVEKLKEAVQKLQENINRIQIKEMGKISQQYAKKYQQLQQSIQEMHQKQNEEIQQIKEKLNKNNNSNNKWMNYLQTAVCLVQLGLQGNEIYKKFFTPSQKTQLSLGIGSQVQLPNSQNNILDVQSYNYSDNIYKPVIENPLNNFFDQQNE